MAQENHQEVLYHFTSAWHLDKILEDGYLQLTQSNLLPPSGESRKVKIGEFEGHDLYKVVDDTSEYHPVVWLTREDNPTQKSLGLGSQGVFDKTEIRITIPKTSDCEPWKLFADRNRMKKSWRKKIEAGLNPSSWYVCEHTISIEDFLKIENMHTGEEIEI